MKSTKPINAIKQAYTLNNISNFKQFNIHTKRMEKLKNQLKKIIDYNQGDTNSPTEKKPITQN